MYVFSLECLVFAAIAFAAASYRYVYRVSTIRLIHDEYVITWTDLDKMFCGAAVVVGLLFGKISVQFGTTISANFWLALLALLGGAIVGRLLAVRHLRNFRNAVFAANSTRSDQVAYAKRSFPSNSDADLGQVALVDRNAGIVRNIAVDKAASLWLRK